MRSQNCYNFLGPIVAISGKRKKKKTVHLARRLRGNWTYKSQSIFSCWLGKQPSWNIPVGHFGFRYFIKLKQNEAIMGFWKVLTICLPKQYAVSNLSYFTQIFYSKVRLQCAFIHGGNHLSGTAELVETSEI